jgi:hypothetical protein
MEHLNRSIETELSGSRIILEAFLQEGVKTVFGYPGELLFLFMMHFTTIRENWSIFWSVMSRRPYTLHRDLQGYQVK